METLFVCACCACFLSSSYIVKHTHNLSCRSSCAVKSGSVPSPLLKLEPDGHHRSGSSSDSFVCVSEETGERAPSQEVNDSESWVCLSEISQAVPQEDVDVGGVVEILDAELDNCSGSGSNGERLPGDEKVPTPGEQDSGGSDWENWDD